MADFEVWLALDPVRRAAADLALTTADKWCGGRVHEMHKATTPIGASARRELCVGLRKLGWSDDAIDRHFGYPWGTASKARLVLCAEPEPEPKAASGEYPCVVAPTAEETREARREEGEPAVGPGRPADADVVPPSRLLAIVRADKPVPFVRVDVEDLARVTLDSKGCPPRCSRRTKNSAPCWRSATRVYTDGAPICPHCVGRLNALMGAREAAAE